MKKIISVLTVIALTLTFLSGCKNSSGDVVVSVNDEAVTRGELLFFMASTVEGITTQYMSGMTEQQKKEYWNTEIDGKRPADYIKESALSELVYYAVLAQAAKDADITVTGKEVNSQFDQMYDSESVSKLKEEYGVTKSGIKAVIRKQILKEKYVDRVLSKEEGYEPTEEALSEIFNRDYIKAKHILVMTVDPNTNQSLDDETVKEKEKLAESILKRAKSGEDFDDLMMEYSEDTGLEAYPEGYVFTEGEMVTEFYEGAKELEVGEISDIVTSSYGYHIIKRTELLATDMKDKEETLKQSYENDFIDSVADSLKSKYKINQDDAKIKEISVKTGY